MIHRFFEKTSPVKKIRTFVSEKTKESYFCESKLELTACMMMEFDDSVKYYQAQPKSVRYRKGHRYTPDLLVVKHDGQVYYVEVKPYEITLDAAFIVKHQLVSTYLSEQEHRPLYVLTERDISSAIEENCTHLYRYRTEPIDPNHLSLVCQSIGKGNYTWGAFRKRIEQLGMPGYFAQQMLAYKLVSFDFEAPINNAMQVVWS